MAKNVGSLKNALTFINSFFKIIKFESTIEYQSLMFDKKNYIFFEKKLINKFPNLQVWARTNNFQITKQIPYPLGYQLPLK